MEVQVGNGGNSNGSGAGTGGNGNSQGGNQNGSGGNNNEQTGSNMNKNLDIGSQTPDDGYQDSGTLQRPQIGIRQLEGCELYNEKYYTGGIKVIIADPVLSNLSTAKTLHYQILDRNGNDVTQSASGGTSGSSEVPETSFDMMDDGIYTIRAWADDGAGHSSMTRERQIIIDQVAPTAPTFEVNGTHGPNAGDTTYVGVITVAIKPGMDSTAGIWGIEYNIVGTNGLKKPQQYKTNSTYTISLTKIGENTVYAKTRDNAGHYSEEVNTGPLERVNTEGGGETQASGVTLRILLSTENSISAVATITGSTRQITEYDFRIGTAGDNLSTVETRNVDTSKSDGRRYDYTYLKLDSETELTPATGYYMQVIARDLYGVEYSSTVVYRTTNYNGYSEVMRATDTTLTGKSIDYMPENSTYTVTAAHSGHSAEQTMSTEDLGWLIWGEDDTNLYLICNVQPNNNTLPYFYGARWYL